MFTTVRHYERGWLLADLTAGIALTAFLVPTGMGYATAAGGRTQLAGLVAAGGVAAVIAWAPEAVSTIPKTALAAVVIAACASLIDAASVVKLARIRPGECALPVWSPSACCRGFCWQWPRRPPPRDG